MATPLTLFPTAPLVGEALADEAEAWTEETELMTELTPDVATEWRELMTDEAADWAELATEARELRELVSTLVDLKKMRSRKERLWTLETYETIVVVGVLVTVTVDWAAADRAKRAIGRMENFIVWYLEFF